MYNLLPKVYRINVCKLILHQGRKYGLLEGGIVSVSNTPGADDNIDMIDMWLLDLTSMADLSAPIVWINVTGYKSYVISQSENGFWTRTFFHC